MRSGALFSLVRALGILMVSLSLTASAWAAPKYKVLHSFGSGLGGEALYAPVVMDATGNLYGTTVAGGAYYEGTVFKLSPGSGGWVESVLYSFGGTDSDGANAQAALAFDALGNLYGTTVLGGAYNRGTVFELTPGSNGWTESILYSFGGYNGDGGHPYSGVVLDGAGNLYGATPGGGSSGYGTVYELSPGSGGWNETLLYSFPGKKNDGYQATWGLIWDDAGNLYGTTLAGGAYGRGTVFELRHTSGGAWKERVLYSFGNSEEGFGSQPGPIVFDKAGDLYGTLAGGGNTCAGNQHACGQVYKLSRDRKGRWEERVLHDFSQDAGGFLPQGGVTMDKGGNLYGIAAEDGDPVCGCGVVYKLAPRVHGRWKYTALHRFAGADGVSPQGGLLLDKKGNLYGTTLGGGKYGGGVVFEVTP